MVKTGKMAVFCFTAGSKKKLRIKDSHQAVGFLTPTQPAVMWGDSSDSTLGSTSSGTGERGGGTNGRNRSASSGDVGSGPSIGESRPPGKSNALSLEEATPSSARTTAARMQQQEYNRPRRKSSELASSIRLAERLHEVEEQLRSTKAQLMDERWKRTQLEKVSAKEKTDFLSRIVSQERSIRRLNEVNKRLATITTPPSPMSAEKCSPPTPTPVLGGNNEMAKCRRYIKHLLGVADRVLEGKNPSGKDLFYVDEDASDEETGDKALETTPSEASEEGGKGLVTPSPKPRQGEGESLSKLVERLHDKLLLCFGRGVLSSAASTTASLRSKPTLKSVGRRPTSRH